MTTIATAIRTHIISASITGIGDKVYRDIAPPATQYPYVSYFDQLGDRAALSGDGNVRARLTTLQVDLWQKRSLEDTSISSSLQNILETLTISDTDKDVFVCRLYDVQRIVEFDDDIVHHAFSLNVYRKV